MGVVPQLLGRDPLRGHGGRRLAALHFIGAKIIKRSVRKWIASGRSREDSMTDTPEATVELQSMMMSQRREQRAEAVGQLLQSALGLTIWGTASLLILTQLGINVAPLIASAGVVGVALGFGAQTLIKDYLSGLLPDRRGPVRRR